MNAPRDKASREAVRSANMINAHRAMRKMTIETYHGLARQLTGIAQLVTADAIVDAGMPIDGKPFATTRDRETSVAVKRARVRSLDDAANTLAMMANELINEERKATALDAVAGLTDHNARAEAGRIAMRRSG